MRSRHLITFFLAATVAALVDARSGSARHTSMPAGARALAGRQLLQANQRCPAGCAADGCVLDSTASGYKCTKCLTGLTVDADAGSCACPAGRYATSDTCSDCPKGSFCLGGPFTGSGAPVSTACPANMTTLGRRSTSNRACVNTPGTFYTMDSSGNFSVTVCPANTYGSGLRKQRGCVPCPPGFTTRGATGQTSSAACVVPEGFYVKGPGQVAPCPLGEYKQGFAAAPSCTKCAKGVSTSAVGSSSEVSCTVIQPGFYPATMQGSIVKSTLQCPQSYYCPGGQASAAFNPAAPNVAGTTVVQCPNGLWTEALGATSAVQCMTPPGYRTVNGSTTPCEEGAYRADWSPASAAASCTPCGEGISAAGVEQITQFNTSTAAPSLLNVRASAASCFIKPGQGMYFSAATNTYRAVNCDTNSFGVADATYGLAASPCRDCPAGMQTSTSLASSVAYWVSDGNGKQGFTSPMACVTLPGYGYNGRVASKCPAGSWNAGGNYAGCTSCPVGLSTADDASSQVSSSNCTVAVGFGFHNNVVMPCPVGWYNDQLRANTTAPCKSCAALSPGLTTSQPGGRSVDDCNTCIGGYGGVACNTTCGGTNATYAVAGRPAGTPCEPCPVMSAGFYFDYLGVNQPFTPGIVVAPGADSPADCLAEFGQKVDGAWWMGGAVALANVSSATTFAACVANCQADANCQYVTFEYETSACWKKVWPGSGPSGHVVAFKALVAGDVTAAASSTPTLAAKGLASGSYTMWAENGTGIGAARSAGPTTNYDACLRACDNDALCAGVAMTGFTNSTSAAIASCALIRGDGTPGTFKRSVVKAVATRLTLEAATRTLSPPPPPPTPPTPPPSTSSCVFTYAGQFGSSGSANGQLSYPTGVAVDSAGNVLVADTNNDRIQVFGPDGSYAGQFGGVGMGNGRFYSPKGVAVDSVGNILVADTNNHLIQKFTAAGVFVSQFGGYGNAAGLFDQPADLALDSAGNIVVVEANNHRVSVFAADGTFIRKFGSGGTAAGQLLGPTSVVIDSTNNIIVADMGNSRIQTFAADGTFIRSISAGAASCPGCFTYPRGVALDNAGNIIVADTNNNRVQKLTATGTFLSQFGSGGSGNGQFNAPYGVAVDAAGNLYVTDGNNNRVQKLSCQ